MTNFIQRGNTWHPCAEADLHPYPMLPPGNYVVKQDEHKLYYLDMVEAFSVPTRLYGDTVRHTARILQTFLARPQSTGVLLAGEKGSGKTLLSKNISLELAKLGMPTIIVNTNFCGDEFNTFIQLINQPCAVVFDEFEKVYDREHQAHLLTLLDGVFPTKKLFVLTCNDTTRINSHMQNRPGRIYYFLKFTGLTAEFITEYCDENLKDRTHINKICTISQLFASFNFDMLQSLVEEMNRYNEDPQTALEMLNIAPDGDSGVSEFNVRVKYKGREYAGQALRYPTYYGNPFETTEVWLNESGARYDDPGESVCLEFTARDFKQYEPSRRVFYYKNTSDDELFLEKIVSRPHNPYAF